MDMGTLWQDFRAPKKSDDQTLKAILDGGFRTLFRLPTDLENDFRAHCRSHAIMLLHQSIYAIITLYLLVIVPVFLMSNDASMQRWMLASMLPTAGVLLGMWISTRLPQLDAYIDATLGLALFFCLLGTLYCAMWLQGQYFGQLAAYESIYIMMISFTILQFPPHKAFSWALSAFFLALAFSFLAKKPPYWLDTMLYFGIPLMMFTANGYVLEFAGRKNFIQNLLLNEERLNMDKLREQAEQETRKQQKNADFLALISGNLAMEELLMRTLRFLVAHTDAQVAVAYHVSNTGSLQRICSWASENETLSGRQNLEQQESLMGPALASGEIMLLDNINADYLPIKLGLCTLPSVSIMVLPIKQEAQALAVIELGRMNAFTETDCAIADSLRQHLAYAITAANAREMARQVHINNNTAHHETTLTSV